MVAYFGLNQVKLAIELELAQLKFNPITNWTGGICFNGHNLFFHYSKQGKIRHINGQIRRPIVKDVDYDTWQLNNSIITAWLINSMKMSISNFSSKQQKKFEMSL